MTLYAVYENPDRDGPLCLSQRFNWLAALLPPAWAIAHGLWLELVIFVAAIIGLTFIAVWTGLPGDLFYLLGVIWLGFEANSLTGAALKRRGWAFAGMLNAPDRVGAEILAMGGLSDG